MSFYWGECRSAGGVVPDELTVRISPQMVAMSGTENKPARCVGLLGEVGCGVRCTVYEQRSSTCREFEAAWANGQPNPACDAARAARARPGAAFQRPGAAFRQVQVEARPAMPQLLGDLSQLDRQDQRLRFVAGRFRRRRDGLGERAFIEEQRSGKSHAGCSWGIVHLGAASFGRLAP
ncbi:putative ferredoxin [Pseudomonas aeruginosa VRFPA02]|nr:putative ferredoxin [Pseudomonas aeruginosa VRFPA02]